MARQAAWGFGLCFIALLIAGGRCAKSVKLEIFPHIVEQGHDATLHCHYDLDGIALYSLKWFRGTQEFYRYSPGENPSIKTFNIPYIEIDTVHSNASQVVIRNVDFYSSGNYSCEVTSDSPLYFTLSSYKTLTVVSIPKDKPVIMSERTHYQPGEVLKANCSTASSKPAAKLSFLLNELQLEGITKQHGQEKHDYSGFSAAAAGSRASVPGFDQQQQQQNREQHAGGKQLADLKLELKPFHYNNGQLNLRCIAKIENIYEQVSEVVQLGTQGEPVPERVTSEIASNNCHRIADLTIVVLIMLHLRLR